MLAQQAATTLWRNRIVPVTCWPKYVLFCLNRLAAMESSRTGYSACCFAMNFSKLSGSPGTSRGIRISRRWARAASRARD